MSSLSEIDQRMANYEPTDFVGLASLLIGTRLQSIEVTRVAGRVCVCNEEEEDDDDDDEGSASDSAG